MANRGFCKRVNSNEKSKSECKLPKNKPLFALANFEFEMFKPDSCPMCKDGLKVIKPGSRGN